MTSTQELISAKQTELVALARSMKDKAYCPYSKFRVGAALLTSGGQVFSGCNVENASYGGTICAERTAIVKAVSEGHSDIIAIAVSTDADSFTPPCGICRQFIREFGTHIQIIMSRNDEQSLKYMTIDELLPHSFGPSDLLD